MSLLSDEEIEAVNFIDLNRLDYEVFEIDQGSIMEFARAIESAILEKLASAELPEPALPKGVGMCASFKLDYYTADQLRQAYAQGAAAQLSADSAAIYIGTCFDGDLVILNEDLPKGTNLYTRKEAK